jgi:predicted hydrocarbon binding protein
MRNKLLAYLGFFDIVTPPSRDADKDRKMDRERKEMEESSFFVMPGNALRSLRDELKIAIEDVVVAEGVMERMGFRSGEGMAQNLRMSEAGSDITTACEMLPHLWAQSGFGSLMVECVEEDTITLRLDNSVEALLSGKHERETCNFTKGYIAGLITELLGKRYTGKELQCVSTGHEHCLLEFNPSALTTEVAPEESLDTEEKYELYPGLTYVYVSEKGFDPIYDVFMDKVTHGYEGICISRNSPKKLQRRYNMKNTRLLWLTVEKGDENTVSYPHLGKLHDIFIDFFKKNENPIILLDGLEFLAMKNNYKNTLSFLQVMIEKVDMNEATLLIPIHPTTLQEQELSLIKRETTLINENLKDILKGGGGEE